MEDGMKKAKLTKKVTSITNNKQRLKRLKENTDLDKQTVPHTHLKVMGEKLSKIIATVAHAKKKLALLNRVKEGGECHQKEEELIMDIRMALYKIAKVAQQVTDDTLDAIRTAESALMKL
mmetsp:Transcript_28027/g.56778  ORF Transcript_28027/g.56778 Transcript_28027/m.56778 type:complete len:120 (+) Transcript_28027:2137-2496(+)